MSQLVEISKELLRVINSYIHNKELPKHINFGKLFAYAKRHSLANLLFIALQDKGILTESEDVLGKKYFAAQSAQQISQDYYFDKLYKALIKEKIKFMPLKGKKLRELYPDQTARTSCDIDVFYDRTKSKQVYTILTDMGFKCEGKGANHSTWHKGVVTLEMHHALAENNEEFNKYYKNVWDRLKTDDGIRYQFSNEDFYIYFLVHSTKHFESAGFGIRTILDIYLYTTKVELDREYLNAELNKLGLKKFADCMEELASAWFGDGKLNEKVQLVADYIAESFTYGRNDNRAMMSGAKKGKNAKKAKKGYYIKTLFPPYRSMKSLYPILKYLPFLLPFMWVYKWFEVLLTRRKSFRRVVDNAKAFSDKKIEKINKIKEIAGIDGQNNSNIILGEKNLESASRKNPLIQTINAVIHGTELPDDCDWARLLNYAKRHSLASLTYLAIKDSDKVSSEVKALASRQFSANTVQQVSQEYYADLIFERLKEKNIKFMPLKGYFMRRIYPIPEMRTSCDVDILIDSTKNEEVSEMMKELSFTVTGYGKNQVHWENGNIAIAIHTDLAVNREYYYKYYENVWDRLKTKDGIRFEFSPEDFYIYLIVHAAKHFSHGGFGIRTVLDFYYYRTKIKMDEEYLDRQLEELKLKKFALSFEKLARVWFDGEETDEETEIVADFVLSSATYGTTNANLIMKNLGKKKSAKRIRRAYMFRAIFPTFSNMKTLYPVLKYLPFLLPFTYVIRWFKVLFTKPKRIKEVSKSLEGLDNQNYDKTSQVLKITQTPEE